MKAERKKPVRRRVPSSFAANLKGVMQKHGLTLKACGEICGVHQSVVHEWLQGSQPQDLGSLLNLCKRFQIDFKWLLTGEKSEVSQLALEDIFKIEEDPSFSGLFMLKAHRLKRKGEK